jgi:chitin disaccharide deacetylase
MSGEKYLIVSADDFGQSPGINRGIIEAYEHGIVTSTSLMTRWPAAGEAAIYAREHPKLSVGLHLDLGEWVCREGKWAQLYSVISLDDKSAVEREVSQQFDVFQKLMGRPPTHAEPVRSVTLRICQSLGIPLRDLSPEIHYFTKFYGQTPEGLPIPSYISRDRLIEIISTLPTGLTVITCHPGYADDLKTMYQTERRDELRVLCDPRVRAAIDELGINLCSFNDWDDLKNSLNRSADLLS